MTSAAELMLQNRIKNAAADAERAIKNKDEVAYNRAVAKFKTADASLRVLERKRNEKAIAELESRARKGAHGSVLSYAQIMKAGIPVEVMKARGWENLPGMSGMRKVNPDGAATSGGEPGAA